MTRYKVYFKRKFRVPIYKAIVWVIVSNDIEKSREDINYYLCSPSRSGDDSPNEGLCCYHGGKFALLFDNGYLKTNHIGLVSHEVFHLTHLMLDWVNAEFDIKHDEQGAYLHAYLMDKICGMLGPHVR